MGMKYKGLDAKSELSLQVVTPKGKDTIYTFTVSREWGGAYINMSTEEVTRLRDELSFILEHERQHAEAAGLSVDDPAKLAALTEADFDDIDNLIPTPHGMIL